MILDHAKYTACGLYALCASIMMVSCGGDSGPEPAQQTVRDSTGIRIVEYGDIAETLAPIRVSPEPLYRVGWRGGDPEWGRVDSGTLLSGGRAAVADQTTSQVIVLGIDGEVEAVMGSPGDGPGELGAIFGLVSVGEDTIVVQEVAGSRMTLFHAGELLRVLPPPGLFPGRRVRGTDGTGAVLLGGIPDMFGVMFEEPWLQLPLYRVDLATGEADTVAMVDFAQNREIAANNSFVAGGWSTAWEGGFVIGRGNEAELTWLDAQGEVTQILRWRPRDTPLTDEVWDAYESAVRARSAGDDQDLLEERLAERRAAARGPLPEFSGLIADAGGNVWMAEYDPAGYLRSSRYQVITSQGNWLGVVELPAGVEILDIGVDYLLGVEQDQLEVQAVSLYRIERR